MSAFIGLLNEKYVFVATDTLTRHPTEPTFTAIKPLNFAHKTFHLPQFKSIFAATGVQMISFIFERTLSEHYIGKDIKSIICIAPNILIEHLNAEAIHMGFAPNQVRGNIFLYGLNLKSGKFEGYRLRIDPDETQEGWIKLKYMDEGAITMAPGVENYWEKCGDNPDPAEGIKKLMIIQKEEDENRPVMEQAGIGGEITFTQLHLDEAGQLVIGTYIIHRFPDYDNQFRSMMQASD